ncbi:MAG: hypothetical protein RLZZ546_2391 [Bacteroidota bacterium]|jgi:hypothetical protein
MKFRILIFSILILLICEDVSAQKKRRRSTAKEKMEEKKSDEESKTFTENLMFDLRFGNVGLNNGFSLSLKPGVGYKVTDFLAGGVGGRVFYNFVNTFGGEDFSLVDFGGFIFAKARLGQSFYIQQEFAITRFNTTLNGNQKITVNYPLTGAGYASGAGKWKYGIELMFPWSELARDYGPSLEYWLHFSYNF